MTNGDANTPPPDNATEELENDILGKLLVANNKTNENFEKLLGINRKLKDSTVSQDALIKPIELMSVTAVKMATSVLDAVLYLDKLSVSNSDIGLNLEKMGVDITTQLIKSDIKYGTIEEHLETEIALHRIGIKGADIGLRDSIVLLNKQGNQGEDLLKLMADFSAKGATQDTLEKMAKGIADVSENTSTQARASIRALEKLADVEGVLSVMGLDEKLIVGITEATKGMAPQHATALGEVVKELLASEDPAKLHLYGMGPLAQALRDQPFDEFMKMLKESAISAPQQFAKFLEPLNRMETMGTAISTLGGDMMNSMISLGEGFEAQARGEIWDEANLDKMRSANDTYAVSLINAADTLANTVMAGAIPAMQNLRSDIQDLNAVLTRNLPDFSKVLEVVGGKAIWAFTNIISGLAQVMGFLAGRAAKDSDVPYHERFKVHEDSEQQNPNADASLRREASRYEKTYGEDVMPDTGTRLIERSDLAVMIGAEIKKALLEVDRSRATGQQPQVA